MVKDPNLDMAEEKPDRAKANAPDPDGLTPRQRLFVEEYLRDFNGQQAAIRAGYERPSARVQASRLLTYVNVANAVARGKEALGIKLGISREIIAEEYRKIGFADIRRAVEWTEKGVILTPSPMLDDEIAAAVAEVSEGEHGVKIKLHDKRAALDSLCRMLGYNSPTEITGRLGIEVTNGRLADRIARLADAGDAAEVPGPADDGGNRGT